MNNNSIEFSVVIPTYNRAKMVCQAIDSVLNQTHPPLEIIVVDDGSTDDTPSELKIYREQRKINYVRTDNNGVSKARNEGIKISQGNYIAFLDSDDLWKKNKLKEQWLFFQSHPDILTCHTHEEWYLNNRWLNPKKRHQKYGGYIYQKCLPLCIISPSSVVIHKSVFDKIGYFNEAYPVCEDYDMWLRLSVRYEIGYINKRLVIKRGGHSDQLSKALPAMDYYRVLSLNHMLQSNLLSPIDQEQTRAVLFKKSRVLLQGYQKRGNEKSIQNLLTLLSSYADFKMD